MNEEPQDYILSTENLYKTYSSGELAVEVLYDINLSIPPGEFLTIMGPSGSGKSTLLYLLGGLDSPTSGKILLKGKDISHLSDGNSSKIRRSVIGFVFQFYNLVPNLSVEENILLPVLLDGGNMKEFRGKLDGILEAVDLSDRRKHRPRELSGGQQQRVAIARALINDPDIIFADEPTGNLDSHAGTEVMELLARINSDRGRTIVMVTHSVECASYATRIVQVRDGRVWHE